MGAEHPKVLLQAGGRPLLQYVVGALRASGVRRIVAVVGFGREHVQAELSGRGLEFAVQAEQRGTADALLACRGMLRQDEECVVLCGDAPLVTPKTIARLVQTRREQAACLSVFTARLPDPTGYGRVVRGDGDDIVRIVEQRDAGPAELGIDEVNSGAYAFVWGEVLPALERIRPSPVTGESYLTDLVAEVRADGGRAVAVLSADPTEMLGVNTPEQLQAVEAALGRRRGEAS
jgi:bifunctional N-acetylglucosamine-1-phosphate-uridyltransferase/glucosamine-1-phosphate-acetyltransferase GlmU-like protein